MIVVIFLRIISNKPITYKNCFPLERHKLLSEMEVNYVQDIYFSRYLENLGMTIKEVIKIILDILQVGYCVKAENKYDYLIRE